MENVWTDGSPPLYQKPVGFQDLHVLIHLRMLFMVFSSFSLVACTVFPHVRLSAAVRKTIGASQSEHTGAPLLLGAGMRRRPRHIVYKINIHLLFIKRRKCFIYKIWNCGNFGISGSLLLCFNTVSTFFNATANFDILLLCDPGLSPWFPPNPVHLSGVDRGKYFTGSPFDYLDYNSSSHYLPKKVEIHII